VFVSSGVNMLSKRDSRFILYTHQLLRLDIRVNGLTDTRIFRILRILFEADDMITIRPIIKFRTFQKRVNGIAGGEGMVMSITACEECMNV
jgi:hypothetical protein